MGNFTPVELEKICREMRKDCLVMAKAAGIQGFHFGATLSIIELVCVLYLYRMHISRELLSDASRDRFILSKGHGVPAVYAVYKQMGVISDEELSAFKNDETVLYGHPNKNPSLGIEFSSGSLGQGLSFAAGTALALKRRNNPANVYCLLGDGECDEGMVWEAALLAAKYSLDNLIVIVDCNHLQYDGFTEDIMPIMPLEEKWKAFGWEVTRIDGHDIGQCMRALSHKAGRPYAVIADTVKGKGVSFMENNPAYHHAVLSKAQEEQAWKEVTGHES